MTPPRKPKRSAASTTGKMRAQRVGLPYSYEKRSAKPLITAVSNASATAPRSGDALRPGRLATKSSAAPSANTAVSAQASRS